MNEFSLDREMEIELKATFIAKGKDAPVTGDAYLLRLYDKDFFGEDFLGESKLNDEGEGRIFLRHSEFKKAFKDNTLPDFYFVLYHDLIPVFQSKIIEAFNPEDIEQYRPGEGEVTDLGTYLIDDFRL